MAAVTSRGISAHDLMALGAGGGSDKDIAALAEQKKEIAKVPKIWRERLSDNKIFDMTPRKLDTRKLTVHAVQAIDKSEGSSYSHLVVNENLTDDEVLALIKNCPNLTYIQLTHVLPFQREKIAKKISALVKNTLPCTYSVNATAYTMYILPTAKL